MRYIALMIHANYVRCGNGGPLGLLSGVFANGTGLGNDSIFERIDRGGGQIVLHPLSGGYLQARPDGSLAVNPNGFEVWETFTEIEWPDDRFSLRSWQGKFVCADQGGGGAMSVDRDEAGDWERFYYEVPPAGLLSPEPEPARPGVHDEVSNSRARHFPKLGRVERSDRIKEQIDTPPLNP